MHEIIRTVVLGIIQGVTEFLPVSSSGHLEIANYLMGTESVGQESFMTTVVLHAATALSTIVVFRHDIMSIIKGLFSTIWNEEKQFALVVILSMIPAVFVGLLFEDALESIFTQNLLLVGAMLIITAILLFLADRAKDTDRPVGYTAAIIVGIAQAIATLPGISRSGATISASVLLGIDRTKAARFSFLMVIPLIFGKIAKDFLEGDFHTTEINVVALGAGFIAAFITGYLACVWMIALVKRSQLSYFSVYCSIVGIIAIIVSLNQ